jgi:hypothetical protein
MKVNPVIFFHTKFYGVYKSGGKVKVFAAENRIEKGDLCEGRLNKFCTLI